MAFVIRDGVSILQRSRLPRPGRSDVPAASSSPAAELLAAADISIVIPCHNYAHFLGDCLDSIAASDLQPAAVFVIDDASGDDPAAAIAAHIARQRPSTAYPIQLERVEFRNLHRVRGFGLELINTRFVLFLDADNKIRPDYLRHSVSRLLTDQNAAVVFPALECFGNTIPAAGPPVYAHGTEHAPAVVKWPDIVCRNWVDSNAVCRAELLRQSGAFSGDFAGHGTADWFTAAAVLRSGPWHALRSGVSLWYRIHPGQMSATPRPSFYADANLQAEVVTIVVAFSGRWDTWPQLREWIQRQTWPRRQTRILILNNTHNDLTFEQLELDCREFASVQLERVDVGRPGLAEVDRRGRVDVQRRVEMTVAALYNRAAILAAAGEYLFFLEDDVIPETSAAVDQLFRSMTPRVAAVSGLYAHRYNADRSTAFQLPPVSGAAFGLVPMTGPPKTEHVGGSGFGCLLIRRSVLLSHGLSGDDPAFPHYDINLARRAKAAGWNWILDRSVQCQHLTKRPAAGETDAIQKP